MEEQPQALELETFSAHREWTLDGLPVLTADLVLPRPVERKNRPAKRLDRFYQLQCRTYLHYCEQFLFPYAAQLCRQALENAQALPVCTASLTYRVTRNRDGILSLYTQSREVCGGAPFVQRRGDTWNLATGYPIPLAVCLPRRAPVKKLLCAAAAEEIARQESAGVSRYHEAWRRELRRSFNSQNYYLTEEGLAFFWQMHAIAPAAEGIPAFSLPFGTQGCQLPDLSRL